MRCQLKRVATLQCLAFMHVIKDLCVLDLFLKLEQNENILTHAEECCASVYDDCVHSIMSQIQHSNPLMFAKE